MVDGKSEEEKARIREIRQLPGGGDGAHLLVAWYYTPKAVEELLGKSRLKISLMNPDVLSTHLDVIPCDSVVDRVEALAADQVLDVSRKPPRLVPASNKRVAWISNFKGLARRAGGRGQDTHVHSTGLDMADAASTPESVACVTQGPSEQPKHRG
jgi:hypothetical protein